jgi:shikimate kinase
MGGCHLADSNAGRIVRSLRVPAWDVAVWVPDDAIAKSQAKRIDVSALATWVKTAARELESSNLPATLTENGRRFTERYLDAGLPVREAPAQLALEHGALGAGLSGCGPAVAALFLRRISLPPVRGGTWHWAKVVP